LIVQKKGFDLQLNVRIAGRIFNNFSVVYSIFKHDYYEIRRVRVRKFNYLMGKRI